MKSICKTLAAFVFATVASSAFAQYIWLNENGVKQYSDSPPPASVPKNRIIKENGRMPSYAPPTAAGDKAASASASMTTAEKNADFNKRRMEQEKKEKEEAEKAKQAAEKAKYCERVRNYNRTLASGGRVAQVDSKGERSFMSDEQRAKEIQEAQQALGECN